MTELLEVKDLSVSFKGEAGDFSPLIDINFSLNKGQAVAIVGESGSGKSLSTSAIMHLLPTVATIKKGKIRFDGEDITYAPESAMKGQRKRSALSSANRSPTIANEMR